MAEKTGRRGQGGEGKEKEREEREQAPEQAASAPEEERKEKSRRGGATGAAESLEGVVDRILELPYGAQLALIRSVAPRIVALLDGRDREAFMRQLHNEIELARRGEDEEKPG